MLKMNQKEPDGDKISVLQNLLDNSRQQYNELRLDNRYYKLLFSLLITIFFIKEEKII